jgi:hypothetical protein
LSREGDKRVCELRCEACGTAHSVFETTRDTHGMAVASELQRLLCQSCGAVMFETSVKDSDVVMVLRSDDPDALRMREALRREASSLAARWRRLPERAFERWFVFDLEHPILSQLSIFCALLMLASALIYVFVFR